MGKNRHLLRKSANHERQVWSGPHSFYLGREHQHSATPGNSASCFDIGGIYHTDPFIVKPNSLSQFHYCIHYSELDMNVCVCIYLAYISELG